MKNKSKQGYLVYNYYQDDMRFRKSKPSMKKISPYELPIKISFEIKIPDISIPEISKTIEIPEAKVREAVADLDIDSVDLSSELPQPKYYLANNDVESIESQFEDIGFDSLLDEEVEKYIDWLRELYKSELNIYNRDSVLSVIEDALVKVREKEADN